MQTNVPVGAPSSATGGLQIRPIAYAALAVFVAGALIFGVVNNGQAPDVVLTVFTTRFLGIFIEAVPFLVLGTIVSGLIEAFIRPEDIVRYVPRNRVTATVAGAFLGVVFPVCECGVVPVTRRLFTKGLPMSVGVAFLLAAPFMNPIVFASTYIAFGFGEIFILRFAITAIVAISVGLVFALNHRPQDVLLPSSMMAVEQTGFTLSRPTLRAGLPQTVTVAIHEFFEMGRFLVIGCLMASAMQTFIPNDTLLSIGQGPVVSVLAMQAFAFILSVCSTVDSFLALAFVTTFTTGSIVAFLSFGPMVDVKSMMMFMGVFKRRAVVYLVVLPFLMNLLFGVLINVSNIGL